MPPAPRKAPRTETFDDLERTQEIDPMDVLRLLNQSNEIVIQSQKSRFSWSLAAVIIVTVLCVSALVGWVSFLAIHLY